MENSTGNSKRLAKNTLLLYLRSLIVLVISVYSSRVLLQKLGVDDFGLYGVVGGIVAMFSSLKSVLASAVQRFLNFERGKGNEDNVRNIFNMSVIIHLGISILFACIAEIFGCWYILNHLVIPETSISTALFVFHCSIVATMIAIYTIPYDAVVIANERMGFYAIQSIIDILLKLAIIFLLPLLPFQRVRSYAVLVLVIAIIIRSISVLYTKRFPECRKKRYWNKQTFKELTSFAGWNFFGCISYSIIEEGSNLVLNAFGGVVANAARTLSYQIRSAIMTLSNNVLVASQPFITQKAASESTEKFWEYIFIQSRLMFNIMILTGVPLYVYTPEILNVWLDTIPANTIEFVRTIIIYCIVMSFQKSLDLAFKSLNRMALYQIVDACVLLLTLPCVYAVLKLGYPLYSAFIVFSIIRVVDYVAVVFVANKQLELNVKQYVSQVVKPSMVTVFISIILVVIFTHIPFKDSFLVWFSLMILIFLCLAVLILLFSLTTEEKNLLKTIGIQILKRKRNE